MFEKVFARLLCLYPAAFREKYRDEALELYRDRLQHETGAIRRARLCLDLLVDALMGLPQAWRNSYANESAASLAPIAEGTPTFRMLEKEKLRPEFVVIGGTLTFAVVAGFGLLMRLPVPVVPGSDLRGSKSPIESVLERLNQPPSAEGEKAGAGGNAIPPPAPMSQQADRAAASAGPSAVSLDLIDDEERKRVVRAVADNMTAHYFDREKAQEASVTLMDREERGSYDGIIHGPDLAAKLTVELRGATQDNHLIVEYSGRTIPERPQTPTAAEVEQFREFIRKQNCTIEKDEILPDGIGYLKINRFPEPDVCGAAAQAALERLDRSQAVIIDLRDNLGGEPEMVAQMAAPFFDRPVQWYNPRANPSASMLAPASGSKLAEKPVYILTSTRTFSGAEHFTYNLKMLHRATVVGEATGGATHSGVFHRLDEHFGMGIPETAITNPYGQADWEGTGVTPDVKVPAADALATAEKLAAKGKGH
jgi:hypothetical protein